MLSLFDDWFCTAPGNAPLLNLLSSIQCFFEGTSPEGAWQHLEDLRYLPLLAPGPRPLQTNYSALSGH